MGLILTEFKERIGTITFNNAEKRNCLSSELLKRVHSRPGPVQGKQGLDGDHPGG